jgi:branched-chain amino acid transport system permease protein
MGLNSARKEQIYALVFMLLLCGILPVLTGLDLYYMGVFTIAIILGGVASLWNFIMGYAGIFTFSQTGLFVVGGYVSAILVNNFGLSPWLGMLIATIFNAIIGILIAIPCLKLKGAYVALVTFTFYLVLDPVIKLGGPIGTGGSKGLWNIAPLELGSISLSSESKIFAYYGTVMLVFLILFLLYKLINSIYGRSFIAVRDSENFAENLGIDAYRCRIIVFCISSALTGTLGSFYVHYIQFISPRTLSLDTFLMVMLMIIIGGYGRFPGAFIGAFLVAFIGEILRPIDQFRFLVFGTIMILSIIFMRKGIMGLIFDQVLPYVQRRVISER